MVKNSAIPFSPTSSVELFVDRIVGGGIGIAELNGWKVFVPYAAPQERIAAQLIVKKKDYGVARIKEILEPSPFRIPALCPYYGKCGGCQLQHINYEGQLVIKKLLVNDALQRIGKIFVPVANINFISSPWRYRNKTQYPVAGSRKKMVIGFYKKQSHQVIDIPDCLLQPEEFNQLRNKIKDVLQETGEVPYDEIRHYGNIRHLVLRKGTNGELLLVIVTRTKQLNPKTVSKLIDFPALAGIVQNINSLLTNRVLGSENIVHWGRQYITIKILQKEFRVSAGSFFQVNVPQTEELVSKVIKAINPQGDEVVLDLFCGVGMISLLLAEQVRKVIGIEIAPEAVADARFNARNLRINNAEFVLGDVAVLIKNIESADVVIVDPPRKGCSPDTIQRIVELSPRTVIYVSCNPATLARDLAFLENLGYSCVSVEPLDMFPQTAHVESIAKIVRR